MLPRIINPSLTTTPTLFLKNGSFLNSLILLYCKHGEVNRHDVVQCHRLFEDLTAFGAENGIDTGYRT
ncbi:hypothetical protein N7491_002074 [Penicillium cf. griseofulvum]|nr:hypothetical protein N7491_002074 [Penicillium cf. griseofulvum]KAJ5447734.1 hypothetical protein N7445_002555 [Penicillium cf. griseofulvum]